MKENEISDRILDCCFKIHKNLGPGLFESVYEEILAYEMSVRHLNFERQKAILLKYGDINLNLAFRADFIVEGKVIIELKSVENILPVHKKQLLTYLKIAKYRLGLVINFNTELMKSGITRIVNNLEFFVHLNSLIMAAPPREKKLSHLLEYYNYLYTSGLT